MDIFPPKIFKENKLDLNCIIFVTVFLCVCTKIINDFDCTCTYFCIEKTTINRGVSGFDDQGHGHYFAKYPTGQHNPPHPNLPQSNQNQQPPPRPFQQQGGHHESSGHSQHSYNSDSVSGSGNGNTDKGSYGGSWNYINSNDRNNPQHGHQGYGQSQDKESQR